LSARDNSTYEGNSPTVSEIQFSPAPGPSPCSSPEHWLQSLREDVENEIEVFKKSKKEYENYWEDQYQIDEPTNKPQEHYSTAGQFKGRGPNNVQEDNISEVSIVLDMNSQYNLWLRDQGDVCIKHQCKEFFDKVSAKHDNIDPFFKRAIEATSSKLPLVDSTSKFDKSPAGITHSSSGTFTGAGRPQVTEIYLSVEANYIHHTIAYTVKCVSHKKRELVFTINGMDKCKCFSIRASEKRILQTKKLLNSFIGNPAFVPNNDEFSINAKVHQIGYALYISNKIPMVTSFRADKSQKVDKITLLGNHVIWNGDDFTWKNFLERLGTSSRKHVF